MRVHRPHQVHALLARLVTSLRSIRHGRRRRRRRRRKWILASCRRLCGPTEKVEWVRGWQRHRGATLLLLLPVWSRVGRGFEEADASGPRRGKLWVCVEGEDAGFVVVGWREVVVRLCLRRSILVLLQIEIVWLLGLLLLLLLLWLL